MRRAETPDGRLYTLTDTVGFVRHLPHQLVEAFRSTLEEVADADLVLHVVDGSHPDPEEQLAAVREVLADIDAVDVPEIVVVNKVDAADPLVLQRLLRDESTPSRSRRAPARARRAARAHRRPSCRGPPSRSRRWCRTPTATGLPGARRGRGARPRSTPATAPLLTARVHEDLAAELAPYVPAALSATVTR